MENRLTPCECPIAGYCKRHGVEKSAHLHKLCKNHIGYFTMWEECRGPKQNPNDCIKQSSRTVTNFIPETTVADTVDKSVELPSTMQMAKNFMQSAANHIKNGMKNASDEEIERRLDICNACEFKIHESNRCGKCGCFLGAKTKWESSHCPIGKW